MEKKINYRIHAVRDSPLEQGKVEVLMTPVEDGYELENNHHHDDDEGHPHHLSTWGNESGNVHGDDAECTENDDDGKEETKKSSKRYWF